MGQLFQTLKIQATPPVAQTILSYMEAFGGVGAALKYLLNLKQQTEFVFDRAEAVDRTARLLASEGGATASEAAAESIAQRVIARLVQRGAAVAARLSPALIGRAGLAVAGFFAISTAALFKIALVALVAALGAFLINLMFGGESCDWLHCKRLHL